MIPKTLTAAALLVAIACCLLVPPARACNEPCVTKGKVYRLITVNMNGEGQFQGQKDLRIRLQKKECSTKTDLMLKAEPEFTPGFYSTREMAECAARSLVSISIADTPFSEESGCCAATTIERESWDATSKECEDCGGNGSTNSGEPFGNTAGSCLSCSSSGGFSLGGRYYFSRSQISSEMGYGWRNDFDIFAGKYTDAASDTVYAVSVLGQYHNFVEQDGELVSEYKNRRAQVIAGTPAHLRVKIDNMAYEFELPTTEGSGGLKKVLTSTQIVSETADVNGIVSYQGFDLFYTYDSVSGNLTKIENATGEDGEYYTFHYTDGLLAAVKDHAAENVRTFTYASGELVERWQKGQDSNNPTTFTYDTVDSVPHLLVRVLKPGGIDIEYDIEGADATATDPLGLSFAVVGHERAENAYSGPQTVETFHYVENGASYTEYARPLDGAVSATSTVYEPQSYTDTVYGNVNRHVSVDENGATTVSFSEGVYDSTIWSQTVSGDGTLTRTSIYEYDDEGNLLRSVARNLSAIPENTPWDETYEYDLSNRVVTVIDANGVEHHTEYMVPAGGGMDVRKAAEWDEVDEAEINRVEYTYYDLDAEEDPEPLYRRYRLKEEKRKIATDTYYVVEYDYIQTDNDNPQNVGKLWKKTYPDTSYEEWSYGCCDVATYRDRNGATTTYLRDNAGRLLSETAPSGAVTAYLLNDAGAVTRTTLAAGGIVTNTYDDAGRVTLVEYSDGTSEARTYRTDGDGQLATETSRTGLVTTYHYSDIDGSLTSVTTPDGTLQAMTYDGLGRIATQTDARGLVLEYGYDDYGNRCITTWPDDTYTEQTFDATGRLLASRDRMARVTEYAYDDFGRQTAVELPNGLLRATGYDALSRVTATSLTDATATTLTTAYTLDADGNPTTIDYPDGTEESFTYTGGRLATRTDRAGQTWTYTYTAAGQPDQVLAPGSLVVSDLDYSNPATPNSGLAIASTGPDGVTVAYTYDAFGRRTRETMPDTTHSDTEYGPSGPTAQIDRADQRTEIAYDVYGRRISVTDPEVHAIAFAYTLAGDLTALTDTNANVTTWTYDEDGEGRVTRKTYADSSHYDYTWYADGKLHTRTDAKNVTTTYSWNDLGLLTAIDYPADTDIAYTYDTFGNRTGMTDAAGTTAWSHDAYKRLVSENGPFADNDTVSYTYNATTGFRDTLTTPGNELTFTPDTMGRISTLAVTGGSTFAYAYLARSRQVDTVSRGNVVVDNTFDTLGRLTLKTNKKAGDGTTTVNSYAYVLDNADQRTRTTFADGRYWDYTYDDAGQLTDAVLKSQANTVLGVHGYQYDPMGNPLSREENGQVRTYTFNDLNQFNAATATRPSTTDVRGQVGPDQADPTVTVQGEEDENPVAATVEADGSFVREDVPLAEGANAIAVNVTDKYGRTTGAVRNVTLAAAPVFSYDANGNTTGDGLWDFTWNQENRLVEAVYNVGASAAWRKVQYSYDGLGRRRTKLVYSWDDNTSAWTLDTTTRFVYDGNNLVAELDGDNAILRKYVWGLDLSGTMSAAGPGPSGVGSAAGVGGLLAVSDGTSTHYPTYDANGNITAYLDASDNAVYTAEYSPFGKITTTTGTAPCQFGFSTIYRDEETGFLAYRFRDYDPNLGRWPARDPLGENGGYNLYAMVGNDPVGGVDHFGQSRLIIATSKTGLRSDYKKISSIYDIAIKRGNRAGALPGGEFKEDIDFTDSDINKSRVSSFCKVVIHLLIEIDANNEDDVIGPSGTIYWYRGHGDGDPISAPDAHGNGPTGADLNHERGHAAAFYAIVIPQMRGAIKSLGLQDGEEIPSDARARLRDEFLRLIRSHNYKSLSNILSDINSRNYFDSRNVFKRVFPNSDAAAGIAMRDSTGLPGANEKVTDVWEVKK